MVISHAFGPEVRRISLNKFRSISTGSELTLQNCCLFVCGPALVSGLVQLSCCRPSVRLAARPVGFGTVGRSGEVGGDQIGDQIEEWRVNPESETSS